MMQIPAGKHFRPSSTHFCCTHSYHPKLLPITTEDRSHSLALFNQMVGQTAQIVPLSFRVADKLAMIDVLGRVHAMGSCIQQEAGFALNQLFVTEINKRMEYIPMKKIVIITLVYMMAATAAHAQWLPGKSCTSTADAMMERAIAHMVNLEGPFAVGMANAALMIDSDCGTAHLLKASLSLGGQFGDQAEKLEAIDTESLTKSERAWHTLMMNTPEDWQGARQTAAEENPGVPLFEYWAAMAMENSTEAMLAYAEAHPEYASPAYNLLSYSYAQGNDVDQNLDLALETIEAAIAIHDGPNAYDSKAEHLAEMGDYENAFRTQLIALNYAAGPSVYGERAGAYWRQTNKEAWADSIRAYTKERIGYTMNNDMDAMVGMMSETVTNTSCNSNMGPCQALNPDEVEENTLYSWNEWEVEDIYVTFNEEMDMAITNFISRGNYTMNDSGEEVAYHTRASEVWVLENGWKLAHSNFAPLPEGAGLPGEQ